MTLGFYTRTSTFLTWAMMLLLHRHNPAILDVGDSIIRLCLFWLSFLPTGSVWSWDARHSPERSHKIPLLAAMGLLLQVAFLIFFAGLAKLEGAMWRDGLAVQYALGDALWVLPLGKWIHEQPEAPGRAPRPLPPANRRSVGSCFTGHRTPTSWTTGAFPWPSPNG